MLSFQAAVLALVAVVAAAPADEGNTPSPSATPTVLREIGRVGSTAYCTMLSKRIAPALQGLMKTDEVILEGRRTFVKMSEDALSRSHGHLALDRSHLGQVISAAAHNLEIVRTLLSDPAYFPVEPQSDDDKAAVQLKAYLQTVVVQQNAALNILSGTLETELMGQMQSERDTNLQSAIGKPSSFATPTPIDPTQFISGAGLPDNSPNSQFSTKNLASGTTARRTIYDSLGIALDVQRRQIAFVEGAANQAVVKAVPLCTASVAPSPAPTPSAQPP